MTEAQQINELMVKIATLSTCFVMIFILAFWYRAKVVRMVVREGRILVETITAIGTSWKRLIKPEGDMLIVTRKKGHPLFYDVTHLNTFQSTFPEGWCPGFFQAPCRKVTIDEESGEPISNRAAKINLSPLRLANMLREQWTSMGADRSVDENEVLGRLPARRRSGGLGGWAWVVLGLVVVLGIVMYFGYQEWENYKIAQGISCLM